ncbi:MAG: hypothetical protein AAFQ91_10020 [Cyanobacteria bacterium J06621_15]
MSTDAKSLNQQNNSSIITYIIINILIFLILCLGISVNTAMESILEKLLTSAPLLLVSSIFAQVINGQLSPNFKAILVFWRIKEPLPGCRAFSYFMDKDPRIDPNILKTKFGNLPSDPTEQNRLWYKIYKKHESKTAVEDAHQKFILTRDLAGFSFLFLVVMGFAAYFLLPNLHSWIIYTSVLILMFLINSMAARNYGIKFVNNVLAEESSV